jgi:DNA polymerase/3'-5' exonuclease PolX
MRSDEIAEIFAEIADMLELRNDNFYHKRAYRLAAEGVRDFPEPIKLLSRDQLQKNTWCWSQPGVKVGDSARYGRATAADGIASEVPAHFARVEECSGAGCKPHQVTSGTAEYSQSRRPDARNRERIIGGA